MGIEGVYRELLRRCAEECFFPQRHPETGKLLFPELGAQYPYWIEDLNFRVRSYALAPIHSSSKSPPGPYACRTWGQVFRRLAEELHDIWASGPVEIRMMLDFNSPPNKGFTQAKRQKSSSGSSSNLADAITKKGSPTPAKRMRSTIESIEAEEDARDPYDGLYEWPEEEDGSAWFAPEQRIQCSFDNIYYAKNKQVKMRWVETLTRFLLYEMPIPLGKVMLLDCGVLDGQWFKRPLVARITHPFGNQGVVDEAAVWEAARLDPGCVRRVVEPMADHPDQYWSYCEADDRLVLHVYHITVCLKSNVIVSSGDGDTTIALVNTFRERRRIAREGPIERLRLGPGEKFPSVMHLMKRRHNLWNATGERSSASDTLVIDADRLSLFIGSHYGGVALSSLVRAGLPARIIDGNAIFSFLVALRDTDYTHAYPCLSWSNVLETFEMRPDLLAEAFHTEAKTDQARLGVVTYLDCSIHVPSFIKFLEAAAGTAYDNGATQARPPSEEVTLSKAAAKRGDPPTLEDIWMSHSGVYCIAARLVWTVDKFVNAGLPNYCIPNPFARDQRNNLPLYGYEQRECPGGRKRVSYSRSVNEREWMCIVRK